MQRRDHNTSVLSILIHIRIPAAILFSARQSIARDFDGSLFSYLVHISQVSDRRLRHPSEAVRVGDVVRVKVLEVDEKRKRISLSLRQAKE